MVAMEKNILSGWLRIAAAGLLWATTATAAEETVPVAVERSPVGETLNEPVEVERTDVQIPYESRPAWVESIPLLDGDLHQIAVTSGPFYLKRESLQALDDELKKGTDRYINDYLDNQLAASFLRYDLDWIKSELVRPENTYHEIVQVSFGPMHQSHALLEFDLDFRNQLDARWKEIVATSRLLKTGLGAGAVLALLGVALGYLKADTATRGFYTRRLQLAASVVILALVAVGALLAKWIPVAVVMIAT